MTTEGFTLGAKTTTPTSGVPIGIGCNIIRPYKLTSYESNMLVSQIVGTSTNSLICHKNPKQLMSTNFETIGEGVNSIRVYDWKQDINMSTETFPLGNNNAWMGLYSKTVKKDGYFTKEKEVFELNVPSNNTATALTNPGNYPSGPGSSAGRTPDTVTTSNGSIVSGYNTTLNDNTIPTKTNKKIGSNSLLKVSPSGAFSVTVTNEGKAIVSSTSTAYNFNIPSNLVFDPRYVAVSNDSITLVEKNCSVATGYSTDGIVYTYSDIKSASTAGGILNDRSTEEQQIRAASQYILLLNYVSGPTDTVTFKLGNRTSGLTWLSKIIKPTSSKKNIKIYFTQQDVTNITTICIEAFLGNISSQATYNIKTTKITC